jgi:sialic acid synthase SpsE
MRMTIGGRSIGGDAPLFVVAEIGLNHGGSVDEALALVDAAADAGASAVKLQSLRGDTLVAPSCPPPAHVISDGACDSLQAFFRTFELDADAHRAVQKRAAARGVVFMSTPFDEAAVEMLLDVGCEAFKIASGDLTHHGLIECAAATGKPLIMSTGMSELADVAAAVACARTAGARDIALLHCVSSYPVPNGSQNLRAIATLAREFKLPVGLSDHGTEAMDIALAVALGACIYEKHIVTGPGSAAIDAPVSATPRQLEALIGLAERARQSLGHGRRTCSAAERANQIPSRRSLYAARTLPAGHEIGADDLIALRPATGLGAQFRGALLGTRLRRAVRAGEPFVEADLVGQRGGRDAA